MKTISVYDAVKLATKGPLFRGRKLECEIVQTKRFTVAECHETNCVDEKEARVNAALLAHFFNHGPSLIAMLEEFVKLYEPYRKQLDTNETEILDEAVALIAKASKVEVEE